MIYLKSVGSFIDPNTAIIYPFCEWEKRFKKPISLLEDEVSMEWWG